MLITQAHTRVYVYVVYVTCIHWPHCESYQSIMVSSRDTSEMRKGKVKSVKFSSLHLRCVHPSPNCVMCGSHHQPVLQAISDL